MTIPESDSEAKLRSLRDELDVMQREIEAVGRSQMSTDDILASLPPETAAIVRAKIAELAAEGRLPPPPVIAPAPPPSPPRLNFNLKPGAEHPYVDVPFAPEERGAKHEVKLKDAIGEQRWAAFKRLQDEFNYSLRCARDAVELLGDAITHDDFDRWMPKARKEVDVATARFVMIEEDLNKAVHEYADAVRAELRQLEASLERLVAKGPPQTHSMKITGEYER